MSLLLALPELSDDLLGEAFLRLPPDDPACLLRASLACKRWRRILADPVFRRRHRELHRTPSVMGFLCFAEGDAPYASRFVTNNPASGGRPAARDLPGRHVLDCRHGRVLFLAPRPSLGTELSYELVVWNPLTNEQRCLPRPSPPLMDVAGGYFNAAVLCSAAMEGCDHSMCHGGPFRVALAWGHGLVMHARVYSSEKDSWSEPISVQHPRRMLFHPMLPYPSTIVGDTLYFHYSLKYALEYQLGAQRLSIIEEPPRQVPKISAFFVRPMGEDGLGCMDVEEDETSLRLQLWSREAAGSDSDGVAGWTKGRAIDLEKLLPNGALPSPRWTSVPSSRLSSVQLLGFAEGTDVIFVGTWACNHPRAVYMVELDSGRARKVFDKCNLVFPYTSFCIPGIVYVANKYDLLASMCCYVNYSTSFSCMPIFDSFVNV